MFFNDYFSSSQFNSLYWPTNVSNLVDGLHDRTLETKMVLNLFSVRNLETFLLSLALFSFYISDYLFIFRII